MLEVAVRKRRGEFLLDAGFEIPGGGVVALFGRSGCGKTTLVETIAGLVKPDVGTIRMDDVVFVNTADRINLAPERRRVGYVFQEARLFPHLNVLGNLRYGFKRARPPRGIGFDEVVGLLGLETLLRRRPNRLSGGERQRVAIGRALLAQPRLLLLDEPLASLDAGRRDEVLPYLEKLRDSFTLPIVYVSHQFDEVLRLATHVVLLEEGRVLAKGELATVCLDRKLRSIAGPDAIGAVVDGEITGREPDSGLVLLRFGDNTLRIAADLAAGSRVRVRLPARDLIIALEEPRGLSVRNALRATVTAIEADDRLADLVRLDMGGKPVVARITRAATRSLELKPGLAVWVLVKSISLRGQSFSMPESGS
ncbi:MAG: molybdenum ABC transporter ATP-binding protein [Steroidobacteraceae bacterium]